MLDIYLALFTFHYERDFKKKITKLAILWFLFKKKKNKHSKKYLMKERKMVELRGERDNIFAVAFDWPRFVFPWCVFQFQNFGNICWCQQNDFQNSKNEWIRKWQSWRNMYIFRVGNKRAEFSLKFIKLSK